MIGDRTISSSAIPAVMLSAWLGAAVLTAVVVAPAAFAVLPSRTLAGALVGRILPVLFYAGAAVGALAALLGRATPSPTARLVASAIMIAACLTAQLLVAPRIERVRAAAGRPIDELAAGDRLRADFGRLHGASVILLGVAAIAGAAALVLTLRAVPIAGPTRELSNISSPSTDDG